MSTRARRDLSLRDAIALGALQGPTELLPVSSSGHTTLIPWLAGSGYATLDGELRKALEVALHAGAGAALAIDMRRELRAELSRLDARQIATIALSLAPPALAGLALERTIERRLGGPGSIAAGLLIGALAMALADAHPAGGGRRGREQAGPRDGLALGVAQALALMPGVSRSGAALTVARARGFARGDAAELSWHAALPVILGASALKGWRLLRAPGTGPCARAVNARVLVAGVASAFISTLASAQVLRRPPFGSLPLAPYAGYRCLLAALAIVRLRARGRAQCR